MKLIMELPHVTYDRKGITNAIDFSIEKMPLSNDQKNKLARSFTAGKGIIGKIPKSNKFLLFTPDGVKILKNEPKNKSMLLPPDWQKYAVILKDIRRIKMETKLKKVIRELIREIIKEKWEDDVEIKSTGEHADKTVTELRKELEALKGKKPYDREKAGELMFAIRAKTGWRKGGGAVAGKNK